MNSRIRRACFAVMAYVRRLARQERNHVRRFANEEFPQSRLALICTALIVLTLESFGLLTGFETYALDSLLLYLKPPEKSRDVIMVKITDDDYDHMFKETSPLDADKLLELLNAIRAAHPSVIAVDLETSASAMRRDDWPDAVWSRDADRNYDLHDTERDSGDAEELHKRGALVRRAFLGGGYQEFEPTAGFILTTPPSGLCLFPRDHDGLVRRYQRTFLTVGGDNDRPLPPAYVDSLPLAIVRAHVESGGGSEELRREIAIEKTAKTDHSDLFLNFPGNGYSFDWISAGSVITAAKQQFWSTKSDLAGKIVLVGGAFSAAGDKHATPVGEIDGIDVVAHAVEAELHGGGIRVTNHAIAFIIDLIAGAMFIYLNYRIPLRLNVIINIPLICLFSLVGSYLAFTTFAYWLNFAAVFVGLWIHHLWKGAEEAAELRRRLAEHAMERSNISIARVSDH